MGDQLDKATPSEGLLAKAAEGDKDAFETLVSRHQTSVLNLIYRFIGNRADAEDLAQEVFLRVWQAARTYKPKAKFTTWIYRITINLCFNELKSTRRKKLFLFRRSRGEVPGRDDEYFTEHAEKISSPEDLLLSAERNRQILNAFQQLPANQRMALVLKRFEGLSYQEIGQILGCSVSAVDSLLVRAKRNLREKLTSYEK
ncbi:MAG: RNA polymerase sigma factor [Candidatus Binatia bacterium]